MYRSIVRRRVQSLFDQANRGNWQSIVDSLAANFVYRFVGDSPLGGARTTKPAMQAWFQRIYRLFPDAQFHVQAIVVEGPPWNTRIMTHVRFQASLPSVSSAPGASYENEFAQLMRLRWGRITSVTTIEDTQRFLAVLPVLAAAGIADAAAAPITDRLSVAGT